MVSTYQSSPSDTLLSGATGVSEWQTTVGGVVAACGEAALVPLLALTVGTPATTQEVTSLTQQAVNNHWTVGTYAYAGQSSPQTLSNIAKTQGVTLQNMSYQSALKQYAGKRPIVIGVSNAQAFGGDDKGIFGHYIAVLGVTGPGNPAGAGNYIVSDPNQQQSEDQQLVVYTPAEIAAAQPFSAQVPTTGPTTAPANVTASASLNPLDPSTWLPAISSGVLSSLGISSIQDLLWRTGFIVLGLVLVILGFYIMFIPAEEKAAETIIPIAAKAAAA
jgi:Papain-like cysteine protease AvrRpt2